MDYEALYQETKTKKNNKVKKSITKSKVKVDEEGDIIKFGKVSKEDEEFVKNHYKTMSDEEMATVIKRSRRSIIAIRNKFNLSKKHIRSKKTGSSEKVRKSYIASLDDDSKRDFLLGELRKSSMYKALVAALEKDSHKKHHIEFYEQKYIDFLMDPSVETITSPERDIWHEMTLAQIREFQYIRKEGDKRVVYKGGEKIEIDIDYSKEIAKCQEIVSKCHESLNVTRQQRLKNMNDSAITFAEVIRELRSPETRRRAGDNAALFKYMGERHYNDHLNKNIISGDNFKYDIGFNFKEGIEPGGLNGDFTGDQDLKREQGLVATTSEEESK